jgi:hypothetical protein
LVALMQQVLQVYGIYYGTAIIRASYLTGTEDHLPL